MEGHLEFKISHFKKFLYLFIPLTWIKGTAEVFVIYPPVKKCKSHSQTLTYVRTEIMEISFDI